MRSLVFSSFCIVLFFCITTSVYLLKILRKSNPNSDWIHKGMDDSVANERTHFSTANVQNDVDVKSETSNFLFKSLGNSTINVLFYTSFWVDKFWLRGNESEIQNPAEMKTCVVKNCRFTTEKESMPKISNFDALIFHHTNGWKVDNVFWKIPEERDSKQFYIFAADEPPTKTVKFMFDQNFYNLTMSYRLNSDIKWFYGAVEEIESNTIISPAINVTWKDPVKDFKGYDEEIINLTKIKNKTAAWFCTYPFAQSNRLTLFKNLKNYIDIDVYGNSQTLKCNPYPARCVKDAGKIYKFYLAFENSLCEDYLTEKTFRAMEDNLLPVIYSGVDISKFLPPMSYIDANSFKTVEDLGKYLKFLSENTEEYLKYFWWRKYYKIRQISMDLCEVCKTLNKFKSKSEEKKVESINEFYFENKCTDPKIKL